MSDLLLEYVDFVEDFEGRSWIGVCVRTFRTAHRDCKVTFKGLQLTQDNWRLPENREVDSSTE